MILKKKQRKEFYEELLDIVCKDHCVDFGFCYYIRWKLLEMPKYKNILDAYRTFYNHTEAVLHDEFPELYSIKPIRTHNADYWYPCTKKGWETRINKLYNVIQSM